MANKADLARFLIKREEDDYSVAIEDVHLPATSRHLNNHYYYFNTGLKGEVLPEKVRNFPFFLHLYHFSADSKLFISTTYPSRKSFLLELMRKFTFYYYTWYSSQSQLTCFEDVLIGRGIILDTDFNLLVGIEADMQLSYLYDSVIKARLSNQEVKVDKKVFSGKSKTYTFIKNTLIPIFIENGYKIIIDDYSNLNIVEKPIGPKTVNDAQEDKIYEAFDNIDEIINLD